MKFKIEIFTEMTTGHAFNDVFYMDSYDNEFIEDIIAGKAKMRGFKVEEIYDYKITIENCI